MLGENYRNILNLTDEELDCPIYRVFSVERFVQLFEEQKLTLVKPEKWDDPYENSFLKKPFELDNTLCEFSAWKDIYGQCWTFHAETDAMWRIYAENGKSGVRVCTTPKKLLNAFRAQESSHQLRCYIGKVNYFSLENIDKEYARLAEGFPFSSGYEFAESLLYKREAFDHEQEVRIIYVDHGDVKNKSEVYSFEIDTNQLFDNIMFSPMMNSSMIKLLTLFLEHKNFKKSICTSDLYKAPIVSLHKLG